MHKYFVMQHDQSDCGAACLAMVLGEYGCKLPLSVIRMDLKTDINGSSIYGILEGAKKHGLEGRALSGTIHEFLEEVNNNNIKLPVIANIISKEGYSHFIVIKKVNKKRFYILDPAKKGHWEKTEDLEKVWVGNIVEFTDHSKVKAADETRGRLQKYVNVCKKQYKTIISVVLFSLLISIVGLIGSVMFEYVINGIYSEKFLIFKRAIRIGQTCLAFTNRFDFRAGQHDAGGKCFHQKILERGSFVLNDDAIVVVFFHNAAKIHKIRQSVHEKSYHTAQDNE